MKTFILRALPNIVTLGNTVCGFAALVKVTQDNYIAAAWLVLLAMVFDAMDGLVARLTRQTSELGGQLDSLSDMVSFGVAPAVLVAVVVATETNHPLYAKVAWCFAMLYAVGTALRLARFNLQQDAGEASHTSFMGLPSPAAAGTVASLVLLSDYLLLEGTPLTRRVPLDTTVAASHALLMLMPVLVLVLAVLMTSRRIRYTHLVRLVVAPRRGGWLHRLQVLRDSRARFLVYAGLFVLASVLAFRYLRLTLAAVFCLYCLTGPIGGLVGRLLAADPEEDEQETSVAS